MDRCLERTGGDVYLFTSSGAMERTGLHLAYSYDGYTWTDLGGSFLAPKVGVSVLMRDPCIKRAPDGTFHMVWTSGWEEKGIGYACSKDLIHWSEQKYIEVMKHEPEAQNTWAPELFYDEASKQYIIYWATTIPNRFPGDDGHGLGRNHRMYYVTTPDFQTFSENQTVLRSRPFGHRLQPRAARRRLHAGPQRRTPPHALPAHGLQRFANRTVLRA